MLKVKLRSTPAMIATCATLGLLSACGGGGSVASSAATTAPSGPTFTLRLADAAEHPPAFVGCQDGDGPWKTLSGSGGVYAFTVTDPAGRYGVCVGYAPATVGIWQSTLAEGSSVTLANRILGGPASVSGSLLGLGPTDTGLVTQGDSIENASASNPQFNISGISSGTYDLYAAGMSQGTTSSTGQATKILIKRDIQMTGSTGLGVLDLSASGFAPQTQTVSIPAGPAGAAPLMTAYFYTERQASIGQIGDYLGDIWPAPSASGSLQGTMPMIPANQMQAGDLHLVEASEEATMDSHVRQDVMVYCAAPRDITLPAFPSALAKPLLTEIGSTGSPRVQVQWTPLPGAGSHLLWLWVDSPHDSWRVAISPSWAGTGASLQYAQPDLSHVTGWKSGFGFKVGSSLRGSAYSLITSNPSLSYNPSEGPIMGPPKDGDQLQESMAEGWSITLN